MPTYYLLTKSTDPPLVRIPLWPLPTQEPHQPDYPGGVGGCRTHRGLRESLAGTVWV